MDTSRRTAVRLLAGGLAGAAVGRASAEEPYPNRLVRLVCPFGAGGSPDSFCRMVAQALEPRLNQRVIVENRPGANSILGAGFVAKAAPDGYTLLYGTNSSTSAARALFRNLAYDPINDLTGISIVQDGYFLLLLPASEKNTTLPEFLEKVRKNPERYPIGGSSTTAEVANKLMENAAGLSHTYVRYREGSQMIVDLMGGRLGAAFNPINGSLPQLERGDLVAVAVTAPGRVRVLPEISALAEILPGVALSTWTGFFAPARTPEPIINHLHGKLMEAMREPNIARWNENAGTPLFMTPAETNAFVRADEPRWRELLRLAGIAPE